MASSTQVAVVATAPPSDGPVQLLCPRCQQVVLSKVDYTAGLLTYLFCGGLFLCGKRVRKSRPQRRHRKKVDLNSSLRTINCVLGCCLIPFCVNRLKNAQHSCPTCKSPLGVYKRL